MKKMRGVLRGLVWSLGCLLLLSGFFVVAAWWLFPFPVELLESPASGARVYDRHGVLLAERVGADEQFCRPVDIASLPAALIEATVAVEDQRYFEHAGVDPLAVLRATGQNLSSGRVVSGASTLSMQVVRLLQPRPRTLRSKLIEAFRALQLERLRDKREILELYFQRAPYGGNLRGVEAAAWAHFGRDAAELSVGECALLAGLPQSPSRLDPRRNPEAARRRQRAVLARMQEEGALEGVEVLEAARAAVRREARGRAPPLAPHAVAVALTRRPQGGVLCLDAALQQRVQELVLRTPLEPGLDLAVVVLDVADGSVLASVGSADFGDPRDGQVDGTRARRSPGSTLKPFLYALAFEDRRLAPDSIVVDRPIERGGWVPSNFDHTFAGPLSVAEALQRSRNVPAILVAESLGPSRCVQLLRSLGLEVEEDADQRRGLALATGAVELSLRALTNAYATLAREGEHLPLRDFLDQAVPAPRRVLEVQACRAISHILSSHSVRPRGMEALPQEQVPWFAWKTGTSSARRDAWAVGHNGRAAVGVWAGHFRGSPDSALVGRRVAEPVLAQLFSLAELEAREPARPQPWPVRSTARGFDAPPPGPLILSPSPELTLIARDGCLEMTPVVHGAGDAAHWFLNGRCIARGAPPRLELGPGRHELRCVDLHGRSAAVSFRVR